MAELPNHNAGAQLDEICDDPKIAHFKIIQQKRFERHAQLTSIAETARFIAGPMLAIGASTLISGLVGAAAMSTVLPVAISLLSIAGAALVTAISSSYAAHKVWSDGQFNNYEISAKSTAHHMVQEMKAAGLEVVHHEETRQGDGKNWQEYISTRAAKLGEAQVR